MDDGDEYRSPTSDEIKSIEVLLHSKFKGSDELGEQLRHAEVKTLDGNGSLGIRVYGGKHADVLRRVPAEAEFNDIDGVKVHVLLHIVGGVLNELEVYREDSGSVVNLLNPEEWRILVF